MPPSVIPLRSLLPVESESISRMPCQPFWALVLIIMISTKAQACKLLVGGVKLNCHTRTHTLTGAHTEAYKGTQRHVGSGILYAKVSETNSIFKPTPWNCFPSLFLCFYLCLFFLVLLFYISTFVVHDIDTIAQSLPLCVCVCAAWLPSEPLSRRRLRPSTSPFTPCTALPYGNRWQLGSFGFGSSAATSQNAHNGIFLLESRLKRTPFSIPFLLWLGHFAGCEGERQQLEECQFKKELQVRDTIGT